MQLWQAIMDSVKDGIGLIIPFVGHTSKNTDKFSTRLAVAVLVSALSGGVGGWLSTVILANKNEIKIENIERMVERMIKRQDRVDEDFYAPRNGSP